MSDDIVTRLREYSLHVSVSQCVRATMLNGADEIERLRELLWKYENCEMVCESPCEPDWSDGERETCDTHRKAVRGE